MVIATIADMPFAGAHERDCARAFTLVARGAARSRAEIGEQLGLRSTTTSRVVGDLVARRLVLESAGEKAGRGRPAGLLTANSRRIGASVLHVASRSLAGALVDLNGQVIEQRFAEIAPDADNAVIAKAMAALASGLADAMPRGMEHAGTAVSLSGLLDLKQKTWLMSSRWPSMRGLDVQSVLAPITPPVEVCRNLDAELRARAMQRPAEHAGGALLLHWGWGVGLAYAVDGQSFAPAGGSFGEIGHWRFQTLAGRACGCGNTACLETGAALWALMPRLRQDWPELSEDEAALQAQLPDCDLMSLAEIDTAARLVARALANVCRLLFPARITVTGPLVANARLWAHFDALFRAEGVMQGMAMPQLGNDRASQHYEIYGAAQPLLSRAVERALSATRG
ncbi:ROK family transcriptional regulator [Phreatobacter stygius]|uniref:ROK family transcriptional regulator n=1 Tax=Phreatobacter stygius TaxID=1940610 RepID=UPI00147715E0|nr:ROK family transcriptional regulator [Phreatobacter stygius]